MPCKNCGCSTPDAETPVQLAVTGPVVALTRFTSLAECGFFADELTDGAEIPTQTQTQDEFDPLTNTWRSAYVLCVEQQHADRAMAFLTQRIAAQPDIDIDGDDSATEESASDEFATSSGGGWFVPLLLTAIVAGGGWWLYRDYAKQAAGSQLASELGRYSQQWVQKNSADRIVRRMSFDAATGEIQIAEDNEGDGEFERTRKYSL